MWRLFVTARAGGCEKGSADDRGSGPPIWIDRLLAFASMLALAVTLLALYLGWHGGHSTHSAPVADFSVNLTGRVVREHCATCHPPDGVGPGGRKHPDLGPHSTDDLGCTGCHLGEGMALDTVISHGMPGLGGRRVLAKGDVQAACYRCHELKPLLGAKRAWNGYRLFEESACGTCHYLPGVGEGGRQGPDLTDLGSLLALEKIREAISEPRKEPENSTMPRFPLSEEEVRDLGLFLKSRVENPAHLTPMMWRASQRRQRLQDALPGVVPTGAELLKGKRCLACHRMGESGSWIGPDLTHIAALRAPDYLQRFLRSPGGVIPGAAMPRIVLNAKEEVNIVEHLLEETASPMRHAAAMPDGAKHLYMHLCQPCHAANGDGRGMLQPNLATFPRALKGNRDFFRSIPDERIVASVEKGVPGTSMPAYGRLIGRQEIESILNLVFRFFVRAERADKALWQPLPGRSGEASAEMVGRDYLSRCVLCHGRAWNGKGLESQAHQPRPRDLTNQPYFAALDDDRIARAIHDGVPGTAMPAFRNEMRPGLLWGYVRKIRELSKT